MMSEMDSYTKAFGILASGLSLKAVLITLGTIRARFNPLNFIANTPEDPKSKAFMFIAFMIFKPLLLAGWPGYPKESEMKAEPLLNGAINEPFTTLTRLHINAMEQEPWFLAMAAALLGMQALRTQWLPNVLYAFLAFRVAHMIFYLLHMSPWRTLAFTGGVVCNVVLAVFMLTSLCF
jgi:uncharacterized MAPEG superfamily protein